MNTYLIKIKFPKRNVSLIISNKEELPNEFLQTMAKDTILKEEEKVKEIEYTIENLENVKYYSPELTFTENKSIKNAERPEPVEDSRM